MAEPDPLTRFCTVFQAVAFRLQQLLQRHVGRQCKSLSWLQFHCLLRQVPDVPVSPAATLPPPQNMAIVVHIHYAELWANISSRLQALLFPFDLIVTVTGDNVAAMIGDDLALNFPDAQLIVMENRGRDVAPFLRLLTDGVLASYDLVCKLHAKKSPHRRNGTRWRDLVLDRLIGSHAQASACIARFMNNPGLGMLGPRAYGFRQSLRLSTNGPWLLRLAARFGLGKTAFQQRFFAGTMFWLRPEALAPLMQASDLLSLFEAEAGQIDGTLAHGLERAMPMIVRQGGYQIETV